MARIEILGVPHAYELTAPTTHPHALVFIHGWLNSRGYWQPVISHLSVDFQCLSYDLRGFGESQPEAKIDFSREHTSSLSLTDNDHCRVGYPFDSVYTPAAYAQDLAALLQQMNITSAWLVGHSLGGTIALWGAAQMLDRVKGVICINAGGGIYLKEAFEQLKQDINPDLVLTHYRNDAHQDHRLISDLTWNTFRNHLILEYEIPKYDGDLGSPNFFVHLDKAICKKKIDYLLNTFQSQKNKPGLRKKLLCRYSG